MKPKLIICIVCYQLSIFDHFVKETNKSLKLGRTIVALLRCKIAVASFIKWANSE